jgi:hypothetical protein
LGSIGAAIQLVVVGTLLVLVAGSIAAHRGAAETSRPAPAESQPALSLDEPVVLTYYFYWYDVQSGLHLNRDAPLPVHPVDQPPPSYRNIAWHRKELADMAYAGIDVAMPVYWGFDKEAWSTEGLAFISQARDQMIAATLPAPAIGLFLDTTILKGRDLTKPANIDYFYANVRDFYKRVPQRHWARVSGRPIVWIWGPQVGNNVNQELFDQTYQRFGDEFGVRPFIVRDVGFNCAITGWGQDQRPIQDCSRRLRTDASYVWGAAARGYDPHGEVASVGPGYDERRVPGRSGVFRDRAGGKWYRDNFEKAIASHKQMLALETWNEFHEASSICETKEYGRTYIEMTKELSARYRAEVTRR